MRGGFGGAEALAIPIDIAEPGAASELVARTLHAFGTVDILVHCAATQSPIGPAWDVDPEQWAHAVRVNLVGPFLAARAVLPTMLAKRSGTIVFLSGGGATSPRPRFSAYAASKAGLVRLTETLADELQPHGVRVNAIAPGTVHTRMTEEVLAAGDRAGADELRTARRTATADHSSADAVDLAMFLASSASAPLTGRLVAARWDRWRELDEDGVDAIMGSDAWTIRRVTDARWTRSE